MNAVVKETPAPGAVNRQGTAPAALEEAGSSPRLAAALAPPTRSWRERVRLPLLIAGPALVLAGLGWFWFTGGRYQSTDDAYVRAAQVTVSTNVSARISEIDVRDNQHVHRGEVLFRLDDRSFRIAVDEARARLASVRLDIQALKATYRQRLADEHAAQSELDYLNREYERQAGLLKSGIASQAQVDRALAARNDAQARVAASVQQSTSTRASLDDDPNIDVDHHPAVQQAQAELDRALLNLSYTTITAPIDGVVTRVEDIQVGDYINAATPAFALIADRDVWVEANFKEDQLTHMHAGQEALVTIDAYPGRRYHARVASVSPGTGSDFSLLPPENASGNWVKVVQRLPVRLEFTQGHPPLSAGLSAVVSVDTHYRRHLFAAAAAEAAVPAGPVVPAAAATIAVPAEAAAVAATASGEAR
ncbi:MAG TPA: HlyD family secretion protein [Steroidobacteraceae bacterium]|nr:HlyD family secretion protein [Steroidobacteraceae bacterium]